jgi:hypothetical protein
MTSGLEQVRGKKKHHSGAKHTLINCEHFSRPSLNTYTSWQDREKTINKRVSLGKKLVRNNSLFKFLALTTSSMTGLGGLHLLSVSTSVPKMLLRLSCSFHPSKKAIINNSTE